MISGLGSADSAGGSAVPAGWDGKLPSICFVDVLHPSSGEHASDWLSLDPGLYARLVVLNWDECASWGCVTMSGGSSVIALSKATGKGSAGVSSVGTADAANIRQDTGQCPSQ